MDIELTVRNYRCFGDEPVSLRIRDGFSALVGMNNSGKSSLLRVPYELRDFLRTLSNAYNTISAGTPIPNNWWSPLLLAGERVQRATAGDKPWELWLTVRDGPLGAFLVNGLTATAKFTCHRSGDLTGKLVVDGATLDQPMLSHVDARPLFSAGDELGRALYVGPFRNAISVAAEQQYYDLQIGTGFVQTFARFKSGDDPVQNEAVVQLIEEVRRIFGYDSLDINASPDQKSLQVTADGRSFRLTELGAGIAHFIVVLVNVLVRRPSVLLIDEPELNLHAALQLDFLATLAKSTDHGVLFATHSLGLARSAADHLSLVSRNGTAGSTLSSYEDHGDLPSLAAQLGFDGRPELGFKKVLLVEGKTEVRSVMQLLRLYGKEHEVALVPLGGGELIHQGSDVELIELTRLGDVSYLIDSERPGPNDPPGKRHADFVALCDSLGIPGCMLDRRALENYLTQAAMDQAVPGQVALDAYGKFTAGAGWSKNQNWRIAAAMTRAELDGTDLGAFLSTL